ncbi:S8 family peptidase [Allorhizocola rhizosphaerae]|uniref:S8 family peptidase n=1 Tax=Allorhizocola rhizosphaerae TaxID=1872709 RepID=UPI000E3DD808|nr:S8 family peptidase [Allorhizocola rhizosphaerae]
MRWLAAFTAGLMVATYSSAAPASAANYGEILDSGGATAIADSYIVVLKDAADVRSVAQSIASEHGAKVGHVYTAALRGFSLTVSAAEAKRIAARPEVAYVSQDHRMSPQGTQPNPPSWGLDRIDQRALPLSQSYTFANMAGDVTAYVIDSGIYIGHPDFGGRARYGWDFVDNDGIANDCTGHGTHIAGIIGGSVHGVAKQAKLVAVRVLSGGACGGASSSVAIVIAGIDWVTQNAIRPAVANLSIATAPHTALDNATANSIASRITYTAAAGNSATNACNFSPARVPLAVTVAASTITGGWDARASFSNHGTCVDLFAPGVNIVSTWITSGTNTMSGTSSAAAHAAGVAALYLQVYPTATPQQVRDAMVGNATVNAIAPAPPAGTANRLLYSGFIP